uniref:Putative acyl-coa synthetase n=1 Tax=Nyssomyia neivai TaxID=330878 RepID=A0A1L8DZ02_9DIPT
MFPSGTKYDSVSKLWSGSGGASQLFHESVTLGRACLYLLNMNPEKICQISADDGSKRTNGEIYKATLNIAVNLQKRGCSKGDVVGFVCRNSHNLTPAFLAAQFLGAPTNALDIAFSKDEICHMFTITKPKFVFCDDDMAKTVQNSLLELGSNAMIIVVGQKIENFTHIDELLDDKANQMEIMKLMLHPPEVDKRSCSAIICSSGTTGPSKGVAISHESLQVLFCSPAISFFVQPNDTMFSFSSLYWMSGYTTIFMSLFSGMIRIITTKPFTPEFLICILKEYNVTIIISTPAHAAQLVNSPAIEKDSLAGLKNYICGGSLVTKELNDKLRSYVTNGMVTISYGMSEAGGISATIVPSSKASVGTLSGGCTAKIINKDDKQLGVGEVGELCVKIRTQFLGYYGNPGATKETLDTDGWIHTGDLGYFDEDGLLYISGRKKDILKYNNYHVTPSEIEEILETHPGVSQAVVVGIPDQVFTDLPAAVIIRKNGASVTEDDLVNLVEKSVSDYKRLRGGVYFVNELPLTPSGKIKKLQVKDLAVSLYKATPF